MVAVALRAVLTTRVPIQIPGTRVLAGRLTEFFFFLFLFEINIIVNKKTNIIIHHVKT